MFTLRSVLAAAVVFVSSVQADYVIDPESVPLRIRNSWCSDEKTVCPIICSQFSTGKPIDNTCDPETLTYGCLCSNNMQPNISEYSLTIPFYTCQEWGNQCVAGCGSDNLCSASCREDHPCGALDPSKPNTTTSATSSSSIAAPTPSDSNVIFNGPGSDSASSNSDSGSNPTDSTRGNGVLRVAESSSTFGLVVIAASFFLGTFML